MRSWLIKASAVTVILMLSAAILGYGHVQKGDGKEYVHVSSCTLELAEAGQEKSLILKAEAASGMELSVKAWEQEGQYWLFLPAMFREQTVQFQEESVELQEGELFLESGSGETLAVQILFGSRIPTAYLDTESGGLSYLQESKENRERGSLLFVEADEELTYAGELDKVKVRGNATRLQPKSPFRIGLEKDASLAGLGESKDYVLLAEYGDISLLQNRAAMELAGRTTENYEPEAEHIDLYVNGEYMGVYLLCEGISLGENRLELTDLEYETDLLNGRELSLYEPYAETAEDSTMEKGYEIPANPPDISGGYLLELEYHGRYETEETTGFRTDRDWSLVIKEPTYASREQVEYIRERFQQAENAMYAPDWVDSDTGLALEELVDMESFVHKYLMDEICMNTDPWTSQFLYKERGDDRFYFGPMWDYDMAFGHYDQGFSSTEFYANWHIWYGEVYENPEFQRLLKEEYEEEFLPVLQELTETTIPQWENLLADSARMNFIRWDIEEIYSRNSILRTGDTFEECVESLKQFIEERTAFLSSEWLENP